MKKLISFAAAMSIAVSFSATALADEVTGTVTGTSTVTSSTYSSTFNTIITQADIKPATPVIILTTATPFYFAMGSAAPAGWLGVQTVDTTGVVMTDSAGNEWREVYTWLGIAWIKIAASSHVITL
ncbi:hypothetical protein [Paenibacillus sp. BAC0078]